jgi:predicted NUDIX family phosphoesterase
MKEQVEQVLVFSNEAFQKAGAFTGFSREGASRVLNHPDVLASLSYRSRPEMEVNPEYKQVIPYCVIKFQYGDKEKFFVYERTKKGNDARLHNLFSLGIGGHINPCDGEDLSKSEDTIVKASLREISEEVELSGEYKTELIGGLYDDSNEVGKVHFGAIYLITVTNGTIKTKEAALDKGTLVSYSWLEANQDLFENWSKLVIKELSHGSQEVGKS